MKIFQIKSKKVFAGPCAMAYIAEAGVDTDDGKTVYVAIQEYDGVAMTVAKDSVYAFLAEDGEKPDNDWIETYGSLAEAKGSAYYPILLRLRKVIRMLG